jgi:murein DD-endopeptidase MepM/ murein hydrolase activator NlpD
MANLTIAVALPAQTVTDAATGVAVRNARVDVPQWGVTTVTDSTGTYHLSGVPEGRWVVRVRAPGYAPALGLATSVIRLHPAVDVPPCVRGTAVVTPQITVTPSVPTPGSLVQIVVTTDSAVAVAATLFAQPVTFTRDTAPHRFVGVAAVPLDSTRDGVIALTYRYASREVAHGEAPLALPAPEVVAALPARREALHVAPRFAAPPTGATAHRVAAESELAHQVGTASLGTAPLWHARFVHPRPGRVTSPFGGGRKFNGTLTARHTGTDFAGQVGDSVGAANRGVVAMIGDFFLAGTVVYVDHGGGLTSAYFHLSAVDVAVGDTVERGQRIGSVGATGRVTGPHLHWVVRYGTASVDPLGTLALSPPPVGAVVPVCR